MPDFLTRFLPDYMIFIGLMFMVAAIPGIAWSYYKFVKSGQAENPEGTQIPKDTSDTQKDIEVPVSNDCVAEGKEKREGMDSLLECLEEYVHQSWGRFVGHISGVYRNNEGGVTIPHGMIQSWRQCSQKQYTKVPALVRRSNRSEAVVILDIIKKYYDGLDRFKKVLSNMPTEESFDVDISEFDADAVTKKEDPEVQVSTGPVVGFSGSVKDGLVLGSPIDCGGRSGEHEGTKVEKSGVNQDLRDDEETTNVSVEVSMIAQKIALSEKAKKFRPITPALVKRHTQTNITDIKKAFGVLPEVGGHVLYKGRVGRVVNVDGSFLAVQFAGNNKIAYVDPRDVRYHKQGSRGLYTVAKNRNKNRTLKAV